MRSVPQSVKDATEAANLAEPWHFKIDYSEQRTKQFITLLGMVKRHLLNGRDVVIHCFAGVHRAATTTALLLCALRGTSFEQACSYVASKRVVQIEKFLSYVNQDENIDTHTINNYAKNTPPNQVWINELLPKITKHHKQPTTTNQAYATPCYHEYEQEDDETRLITAQLQRRHYNAIRQASTENHLSPKDGEQKNRKRALGLRTCFYKSCAVNSKPRYLSIPSCKTFFNFVKHTVCLTLPSLPK